MSCTVWEGGDEKGLNLQHLVSALLHSEGARRKRSSNATSPAGYPTQNTGGKLGGADWHGVNKSEWTVFNFILSHTARKSNGERRQSLSQEPMF